MGNAITLKLNLTEEAVTNILFDSDSIATLIRDSINEQLTKENMEISKVNDAIQMIIKVKTLKKKL